MLGLADTGQGKPRERMMRQIPILLHRSLFTALSSVHLKASQFGCLGCPLTIISETGYRNQCGKPQPAKDNSLPEVRHVLRCDAESTALPGPRQSLCSLLVAARSYESGPASHLESRYCLLESSF